MDIPVTDNINDVVEQIERGERISTSDALLLYHNAPLALLGVLATGIRERLNGKNVYYNRNFHIEPTNICVFNCRFCSYRRPADSVQAWDYSMSEVEEIARKRAGSGVTEVHIVGGVHPSHDFYYYVEMIRRVRQAIPEAVVKAFTAIELGYMIDKAGIGLHEGLRILKDAGMEAMPGGGAEIFDEGIRAQICPEKGDSTMWLSTHKAAHEVGISTNATMLYGHIESVEHRIDHLDRLRQLQDVTGGFNAFIPLKYRSVDNSMSAIGEVSIVEDMRTLALARIFLDNFPHIKAYWPMFGRTTTELALAFGADDIDGTIGDTTKIYSMAGAEDKRPAMDVSQIEKMVSSAGYIAVERDTFYNPVKHTNNC